ncbi:MAG: arylesterase [Marinobacter sp.]|nr:arylesterase [Marinobacter sp.]
MVSGAPALAAKPTLLILGDSLSAAYGVETERAWVSLLERRLLDKGYQHWQVANASISGETTDGGLRRLPGLLERHQPAVVVIELGGNDGLRGFPPQVIQQNLAAMVNLTQEAGAKVLLVGIQIPPNYGPRYMAAFAETFQVVAREYEAPLVPFFLEGIYDQPGMMQSDGIHPTTAAQPLMLDNVWPALESLLQEVKIAQYP